MQTGHKRLRGIAIAAILAMVLTSLFWTNSRTVEAATFTVNNTGDGADFALDGTCETASGNGQCTLRAAIQEANNVSGADTISFSLGTGTPKIAPLTQLPDITEEVSLDGATGGATRIELSGENAPALSTGLVVKGQYSTIDSLVVNRWHTGVSLDGDGTHYLSGSYIGTNSAGTSALGNTLAGVFVRSSSNQVLDNLISGNYEAIVVDNAAVSTQVQLNEIGTDSSGTAALPNGPSGRGAVAVFGTFTVISENTISGNNGRGVYIFADWTTLTRNNIGTRVGGLLGLPNTTDGVFVSGNNNRIGSTLDGNTISGNAGSGVDIASGSANEVRNNWIGAVTANAGNALPNHLGLRIRSTASSVLVTDNTISGNTTDGIHVENSSQITNNFIGTNATGLLAVPNGDAGIEALGFGSIGAVGAGNVISGNTGPGVRLGGTAGLVANKIGVGVDGTTAIPNGTAFKLLAPGAPGVDVVTSTHGIGGAAPGSENIIAHNRSNGIQVCSTCTGVGLFNNVVHSNGGLALDLLTGSPSSYLSYGNTANDLGDTDAGANNLQNHPVISSAETVSGTTTIRASLNSTPSTSFVVGFYRNVTCDTLVHGEAEVLIGSTLVATDALGNTGTFPFNPASPVPAGQFVVAGAFPQVSPFNTSELSECATVGSGCITDSDCDGFKDTAALNHFGPANTNATMDNCSVFANAGQANASGNFIDTTPPLAADDRTHPRSDAAGDACDDDDDNDGIPDVLEVQAGGWCSTATSYVTNPLLADTDGDRYLDSAECLLGTDPTLSTSKPTSANCAAALGVTTTTDTDGDKIRDYLEFCHYATNTLLTDSDGDRTLDGGRDGCEVTSFNVDRIVNVADMGILASAISNPALRHVNLDVNKDGVWNAADQGTVASFISPSGQCPG